MEIRSADWGADLEQIKFLGHCFYVNALEHGLIEPMNVYLTIRPVAQMGYLPVALEGEGSNCFSITQLVRKKRQ